MAKRISARRVKKHQQYTYKQAADLLGVNIATVRSWRVQGLQVLDNQKPHLILGRALQEFLTQRSKKSSQKFIEDTFLCMRCGVTRHALGREADYWVITDKIGRLEVLCDVCGTLCGKFSSPRVCAQLEGKLSIVIRDAQ